MRWDQRLVGVAGLLAGFAVWIALSVYEAVLGEA